MRIAARRSVLAVLAAAFLSVGVVASAAPAGAAEAGVVVTEANATQLADLRALGTHWVRLFATWPDLEPQRGVFAANWMASYERTFASLPPGTHVIIDMVDTPQWETGSTDPHTPPANPEDFAAFIGTVARAWAGRVAAYEIWNEEDASRWWTGAPDPAGYTALLKVAYPAVKAADPNAQVVLGGLTGNDYPFLEGVYAAGGGGSFDAVGVHTDTACNVASPYSFLRGIDGRMIPDSFLAYREVHAVMLAHGDPRPIWMTEMSWRTTSATCSEGAWAGRKPEGIGAEEQATFLSQAYHCLAGDPYVQVALWFPLQDEGATTSGLIRANGARKPSFAAMHDFALHGDQLTESCGVFTGPQITVASPENGASYSGPLTIHVSAQSSQGVGRITLKIDGKLIRNYTDQAFPGTLSGLLHWQGAKHIALGHHTLTFIAIDKLRNVTETNVTIDHLAGGGSGRHANGSGQGSNGSGQGSPGHRPGAHGHVHKHPRKRHHKHAHKARRAKRARRHK
jgi:hypothetical protein